ncbi:MAG: PHB depolymerase family esterase [Gammaproteobacteria bacterium]
MKRLIVCRHHRIWIGIAALLWLSTGSALAYDVLEFDVAGVERSARVYPGEHADTTPAPLVFVFHGRGDNERNFSRAIKLHDDWPEATVVYPRGLIRDDEAGMRGWWGSASKDDVNHDLQFVDLMLEELPQRYSVDPARIYVAGFSNGGRFTFILLAQRPDTFAAFVPIGAVSPELAGAVRPRPVMYLFGRNEPRKYQTHWTETVVALVRLNGGTGEKREWAPGLTEYLSVDGGAQTIISLYDAGHVWPYKGNENIIRFFDAHRLALQAEQGKTNTNTNTLAPAR